MMPERKSAGQRVRVGRTRIPGQSPFCPLCGHDRAWVVDTRRGGGGVVRRRRECSACFGRYTTHESAVTEGATVPMGLVREALEDVVNLLGDTPPDTDHGEASDG
jgi:hypothetical protein